MKSGHDLKLIAMVFSGAVSRIGTPTKYISYFKDSPRLIAREEIIAYARHEDLRLYMILTTVTKLPCR
jgi:hypothetical protein